MIVTVEEPATQDPGGSFVVRVNVTVPDGIEGVYVVDGELTSPKVPEGPDHVEEVPPPPIDPVKFIVPPAQTVAGAPAFEVPSEQAPIKYGV